MRKGPPTTLISLPSCSWLVWMEKHLSKCCLPTTGESRHPPMYLFSSYKEVTVSSSTAATVSTIFLYGGSLGWNQSPPGTGAHIGQSLLICSVWFWVMLLYPIWHQVESGSVRAMVVSSATTSSIPLHMILCPTDSFCGHNQKMIVWKTELSCGVSPDSKTRSLFSFNSLLA